MNGKQKKSSFVDIMHKSSPSMAFSYGYIGVPYLRLYFRLSFRLNHYLNAKSSLIKFTFNPKCVSIDALSSSEYTPQMLWMGIYMFIQTKKEILVPMYAHIVVLLFPVVILC